MVVHPSSADVPSQISAKTWKRCIFGRLGMIKPYMIFFHVCHVTFEFVESLIIMLLQSPGHIEVTNLDVA